MSAARPEPARRIQTGKDVFRAQGTGKKASPKVYEGWLVKKPPSQLLGQQQRRRWCVLYEDGELCYYTKPDLEVLKGKLSVLGLNESHVVRAPWSPQSFSTASRRNIFPSHPIPSCDD